MKQLILFLAHIFIFIISIAGLINLHVYPENTIFEISSIIIHTLIVLGLYITSGYVATKKAEKFQLKNYWIVAIIGIVIWLLAFINSPTDLDWKKGNGGILWLLYLLYITPIELPFNFSDYFPFIRSHIIIQHIVLVFYAIIPSAMQALGGFLKTKRRLHNDYS